MKKNMLLLICFTILTSLFTLEARAATIQLPQTGQTGCWDINGTAISCTNTGQDGDTKTGVAPPTPRFSDNFNGTVTDNLTGLVWLQDANCFGIQTWPTALTSSKTLANGICGLTDSSAAGDWRLPNVNELESLIDEQNAYPALPSGHLFKNVQADWYWSSSSNAYYTGYAWFVYMGYGEVSYGGKDGDGHVWPVRAGQ